MNIMASLVEEKEKEPKKKSRSRMVKLKEATSQPLTGLLDLKLRMESITTGFGDGCIPSDTVEVPS